MSSFFCLFSFFLKLPLPTTINYSIREMLVNLLSAAVEAGETVRLPFKKNKRTEQPPLKRLLCLLACRQTVINILLLTYELRNLSSPHKWNKTSDDHLQPVPYRPARARRS